MEQNSNFETKMADEYESFISNQKESFMIKKLKNTPDPFNWELPSSKSHFIRWLFLAAQTQKKSIIKAPGSIGNDILSCVKVLEKLGVTIKKRDYWSVNGCNPSEFNRNPGMLDCGNSATTLRFLSLLLARNGITAKIIGDESLSSRNFSELFQVLEHGGVSIKKENGDFLPFTINGVFKPNIIEVFTKKTSQLISALLITMPSSIEKNTIKFVDTIVSKPYFELTVDLCEKTGSNLVISEDSIVILPWEPQINEEIIIPGEGSLILFPMLFSKLHKCRVLVKNWPKKEDALGFDSIKDFLSDIGLIWINDGESIIIDFSDYKSKFFSIDIRNNIDMITPLSIIMAISEGGIITGIENAVNKETNRIKSTIHLCNEFGIDLDHNSDLFISKSELSIPKNRILANGDHRLQMSAIVLITHLGGLVESFEWYANSDPDFIKRLYCQQVSIS